MAELESVTPRKPDGDALRAEVRAALQPLVGLPLSAVRRAADLRNFVFGELVSVEGGSVGAWGLHVQCAWRIDGPGGIVTGRDDLWEPEDPNVRVDEDWSYDTSPTLQDARVKAWFASAVEPRVVKHVDADVFGGATIELSGGFTLRIAPMETRGEAWRLLGPSRDVPHFVVGEGRVERH